MGTNQYLSPYYIYTMDIPKTKRLNANDSMIAAKFFNFVCLRPIKVLFEAFSERILRGFLPY